MAKLLPTAAQELARRRATGRGSSRVILLGLMLLAISGAAPPSAPRARAPQFTPQEEALFPANPAELLDNGWPVRNGKPNEQGEGTSTSAKAEGAIAPTRHWSELIAAEAIEDEVKALQRGLDVPLASPSTFKAGGNKVVRRQLAELALLFGVIAEFDGQVRWKAEASALRASFARAAANAKVASDGAYKECKARAAELTDLVRGGSVKASETPTAEEWSEVMPRQLLMQRLEQAHHQAIVPWTAQRGEFKKNLGALEREAMLVALMAEVLAQKGYADVDDASYVELLRTMQTEARHVAHAVAEQDYEGARHAATKIGSACTECHEGYRSN